MKGGFYGLKAKELSLILIALVCTSILIWAWEKTPVLTSLLPPRLSPGIVLNTPHASSVSSKPHKNVNEDISSVVQKETVNEQNEQHFDAEDQTGLKKSTSEIGNVEMNVIKTPLVNNEDISAGVEKEIRDGEKKQRFSTAAPTGDAKSSIEISKTDTNVVKTPVVKKEEGATLERVAEGKSGSELADKSVDIVAPVNFTSSSVRGKENSNFTTVKGKQVCNYAKGKWVNDDRRPLYSGFGCKQWLSGMWACRLTQRTDFAYEKLRWQPKNCEMEEFTGSKFLRRMQDKTLAFVGDSLGRQQFQSLMCMITGGEERTDVVDVGREYGLVKARGSIRPDGWAYRFPSTNTTILYYWSASLCDLEPIDIANPATDYAMHLDRPPAFLRHFLHKFDVLVLNTGHHWNSGKLRKNRWIVHVGGVPKPIDIAGAKNFTIYSIVNWVNSQLPKYPGLKAFYRSISPRHFFNGDWNTGGTCDNTTPLAGGKEVLQDSSDDPLAAGAVQGMAVKFLDITALSQLRDEGHISRYSIKATPGMQDCLHWCLPGVPDTWNEIIFAQL
ncbi:hypothetical protein F0562_029796 [Nyssa sinensis]|uniref:Uncharacterized protein n=1 Tax=Nyssa sinensis TaxID=561372 RepID=A0A5J5AYA4_9ASTE|nr:hypothetical protein F0562_029796 [Nyssa sinensis]